MFMNADTPMSPRVAMPQHTQTETQRTKKVVSFVKKSRHMNSVTQMSCLIPSNAPSSFKDYEGGRAEERGEIERGLWVVCM